MKKFLLAGLFVSVSLLGWAQSNKPIVGVENFSGNATEASLVSLRNNLMTTATNTNRVHVVDLNDHNDGMSYHAFLRGQINDVKQEPCEIITLDGKKHRGVKADITMTLTLVDAGDGTTISQLTIGSTGRGHTFDEALMDAVKVSGSSRLNNFIINAFPVGGSIVALGDADSKKAKTVYVDLGSNDGISTGQKLEVYALVDIAGQQSRKLLGELKIEEVMGGNRSLCKVTKNGEQILQEINNGGALPVESKEQKTNFLGF